MARKKKTIDTSEERVDAIDTPDQLPDAGKMVTDPATEHWKREVAAYEERTGEKVQHTPAWLQEEPAADAAEGEGND